MLSVLLACYAGVHVYNTCHGLYGTTNCCIKKVTEVISIRNISKLSSMKHDIFILWPYPLGYLPKYGINRPFLQHITSVGPASDYELTLYGDIILS